MVQSLIRFLWVLPFLYSCAHSQQMKMFSSVNDLIHVVFYKKNLTDIPVRKVDGLLAPYISQFLADASAHGHPVPQDMQDMLRQVVYVDVLSTPAEPGIMAVCARYYATENDTFGTTTVHWMNIEVLRKESQLFVRGNPFYLRELLYHELFHCYYNKGHLPDGVAGVMAPTMNIYDDSALTKWTGLVDDMFSQKYFDLIPDAM